MSNPAYQVLAELAQLSRSCATGLPEQVDTSPRWSGIGFSLMGWKFVVPMGQVSEIMEVPNSTRLPGVQPWVIGLSNVRGRLLPLFDFAKYFGGRLSHAKKRQRVLVLESETLYSGLVIDESFGMQHFETVTFEQSLDGNLPEALKPLVRGLYKGAQDEPWAILDLSELERDGRFTNAALV